MRTPAPHPLDLTAKILFGTLLAALMLATTPLQAQLVTDGGNVTITTSTNLSPNDLYVGVIGGNTTLTISKAGVTNDHGYIGFISSSTSNHVVVDSDAYWDNEGGLTVGQSGAYNKLTIRNGGLVVSQDGARIGEESGTNQVIVSEVGSLWNAEGVEVGRYGNGNLLLITNGGAVTSSSLSVGTSGDSNQVVVAGSGSILTVGEAQIGDGGDGNSLLVKDGGSVVNGVGDFVVGYSAGRTNWMAISGFGSSLHLAGGDFVLGLEGADNTLWITNSALVKSDTPGVNFVMGSETNAINNLLFIQNGALEVSAMDVRRGLVDFRGGIIRVDQLFLTNNEALMSFKAGTLRTQGAQIDNDLGFVLGPTAGYHGPTWFVGDGLTTIARRLTVGAVATNSAIFVQDGATLISQGGTLGSSDNWAALDGSVWNNLGSLIIGESGRGNRLTISNNATVIADSFFVGYNIPSTNNLVILDNGTIRSSGVFDLRRGTNVFNAGVFQVDTLLMNNSLGRFEYNGGTLISKVNVANGQPFTVGLNPGTAPATWLVAESTISTIAGDLVIGQNTTNASMVISNQAAVSNNIATLGATISGSNNTVLVTGGSLWTNASWLYVGDAGGGNQLTVSNAAIVRANRGVLGNALSSGNNVAVVTGPGSRWENAQDMTVGRHGSGNQLWISNGGVVTSPGGYVGSDTGTSNDFAVISGIGSLWTNSGIFVVGNLGGRSQVVVSNNGTLSTPTFLIGQTATSSNNVVTLTGGTINVSGAFDIRRGTNVFNGGLIQAGSLLLTNTAGRFAFNGGIFNCGAATVNNGASFVVGNGSDAATYQLTGNGLHTFNNGLVLANNAQLQGNGTIAGVLTAPNGSSIFPGTSVGRLVLSNSPSLQGTLTLEISKNGSTLTNDQIQVLASLTYGGTLMVTDLGPTTPTNGDSFKLFDATSYAGAFSVITLPSLPTGLVWTNRLLLDGTIAVMLNPVGVTTLAYYRFGENDPGAVNGGTATTTTNLFGGLMNLVGGPKYTNDVSASASNAIASTLALQFASGNYGTNAIVSTLTNNFGIELWVKPDTNTPAQLLAYNGDASTSGWGIILADGGFYRGLYGGRALFGVVPAPLGMWTHLALVRDSGTATLYVNGAPVATDTTDPAVPSGQFVVGQPFVGAMDEVRVFSFTPGGFRTNDLLYFHNVVTTIADSGPGSLRQVVADAVSGEKVTFAPDLSGQTITLTSGQLTVNQSLTIDASALPAGIQINGNANSRVFLVNSGNTVVLDSLTITNGNSSEGGGIYNDGTLTVNRCTLAGNAATSYGGGIINYGTLTVNQCTLTGNRCENYGGAGIDCESGAVTVNQSTLTGNTASFLYGSGGIFNFAGSCTLSNSLVAGNTAPIYNNLNDAAYSFTGVNLTSGDPLLAPLGHYGGPTPTMPPMPGSPAIDGCTNGASFATDQRGFPRIAGAFADIGAVEFRQFVVVNANDGGPGSLRDILSADPDFVTFTNTLSGATILLTSGQLTLNKGVTIDASALPDGIDISGNLNSRVFQVTSNSTVVLDSLTIRDGAAPFEDYGGGIFNQGTLTLTNCVVANNQADTSRGGGIENSGGSLTLYSSTIVSNSAGFLGGGIDSDASGTVTLNQSTVTGNSAGNRGGGINNGNGSTLTLNQSTVTANSASSFGGGVGNSATWNLYNSIVAGNSASIGPDFYNTATINSTGVNLTAVNPLLAPLGDYGGPTPTMPPLPGSPAIDSCTNGTTFTTDQRGLPRIAGAFADIGAVEDNATPLPGVDYTVVTTGADSLNGAGGVSLRLAAANAPVNATITFTNTLSGATILLANGQITLDRNLSIDASALSAGLSVSGNGASRVFQINSNTTNTLDGLTITNGIADHGGGIQLLAGGQLTLVRCRIWNNYSVASSDGGGIYSGGVLLLDRCLVLGNGAGGGSAGSGTFSPGGNGGNGGGIFSTGTVSLVSSTIAANTAGSGGAGYNAFLGTGGHGGNGGSGGGVFSSGQFYAVNTTITGNYAGSGGSGGSGSFGAGGGGNGGSGGGLCGNADSLVHCTVVENLAGFGGNSPDFILNGLPGTGGALYGGSFLMTNSVAANNFTQPGEVVGTVIGLSNLIQMTPQVTPLGYYGGPTPTMHPLPGSPAINAGESTTLTTDQRGFARVIGGIPDIGAVETGQAVPGVDYTRVTTTNDFLNGLTNSGVSLRDAVNFAPGGSTIVFDLLPPHKTIVLTQGQLLVTNNLRIDAEVVSPGVTISGNHASRIFEFAPGTICSLAGLTLTNGLSAGRGGAVLSHGNLGLRNVSVVGNHAALEGGGIAVSTNNLSLWQCTVANNSCDGAGGAAVHVTGDGFNAGYASVLQSTISGNFTTNLGGIGGIVATSGSLSNSIVAGNSSPGGANLLGAFVSGTSLTNGNPMLAPLGDYGGPYPTMLPLAGSPAIDAGTNAIISTDQRGFPRFIGSAVDIGAVESGQAIPGANYTIVTTTNDTLTEVTNSGVALRSALRFSTNGSTITFAPSLSGQTIMLTGGQLQVTKNQTIDASALPAGIQINGNASSRVFLVNGGATVVLDSLTITNGKDFSGDGGGGGIYNLGSLTVNRCTLAGNTTTIFGGGIRNNSVLVVNQSTVTGNSCDGDGGAGIDNEMDGSVTLNQSTVTGNTTTNVSGSGGIYFYTGSGAFYNSIVAGNTAPLTNNIHGIFSATGVNLFNGDPMLASLGNYGGSTPTMLPLPGSPVIDSCTNGSSFTTDQRGFPRVLGIVDIGAVEGVYNQAGPGTLTGVTKLGDGSVQFGFTNYSGMPYTVLATTNVALPATNWLLLGFATETPPGSGQFQFTDPGATNYPQRYYRVKSP